MHARRDDSSTGKSEHAPERQARRGRARKTKTPATRAFRKAGAHAARATSRESRLTPRASSSSTVAGVALSHPDKMMFVEAGITKRDLALYYETVADRVLPHLRNRPLTLVRCPNGWQKHCFYQKHVKEGVPEAVDRVVVPEGGGKATYMMANSLPAVVALVQLGVLEMHPWGASTPRLGFPDRLIFDLDPDDGLPWEKVAEAARLVRSLLEEIGLRGFLKTTGGKGLHVVAPVRPVQPWDEAKAFTKSVAELLARAFPDRFTSSMSKAARRGKIYLDYLRNAEGATAIAAYAIRARAHAPVSTPIHWEELGEDVRFDHFNAGNVASRLGRRKKDPWADFFATSQAVTARMVKRLERGARG